MLARGRPQHDKRKEPSVHPSLGTRESTRRRTERRTGGVRGFCFKPGCGSDDEEEVAHWKSFRTGDLKKRGIFWQAEGGRWSSGEGTEWGIRGKLPVARVEYWNLDTRANVGQPVGKLQRTQAELYWGAVCPSVRILGGLHSSYGEVHGRAHVCPRARKLGSNYSINGVKVKRIAKQMVM